MFKLSASPLPIRSDLIAGFRQVWGNLAAAGTWWTGAERVAIAQTARAAYQGREFANPQLTPAATEAATVLGRAPSTISEELIEAWEVAGLSATHYVELIGVVSRIVAVDTFHRGLGLDLEPMPDPVPGAPTQTTPQPPAKRTKAWVPMVGPPTIPTSLSAVPAEMDALEPLHAPMYLSYEEMGNPDIQKGLHRSQIELVASRTSAINECFF